VDVWRVLGSNHLGCHVPAGKRDHHITTQASP